MFQTSREVDSRDGRGDNIGDKIVAHNAVNSEVEALDKDNLLRGHLIDGDASEWDNFQIKVFSLSIQD